MSRQIAPERFIRYQTLGVVVTVVTLVLLVALFLVWQTYTESRQRLAGLEAESRVERKALLSLEMNSALEYLQFTVSRAESVLKDETRYQVDQAHKIAQALYDESVAAGQPELAPGLIREALRDLRFFNGRGYLFIDDMAGNCVLLPISPEREGQSLLDNRDDSGHYVMREIIESVDNPQQEGYSQYRWYAPEDPTRMHEKITYARQFTPLNWVIGSGDYLHEMERDLKREVLDWMAERHFGGQGYFAVYDSRDGRLLLSPFAPNDAGKPLDQLAPDYAALLRSLVTDAGPEGRFTEYEWYRPGGRALETKLALVQSVPRWDWVVVAGIYEARYQQSLQRQRSGLAGDLTSQLLGLVPILSIAALISAVVAVVLSRWLRGLFQNYQQSIARQQQQLRDNAQRLEIAGRVFQTSGEGMIITDLRGCIESINPAFETITGFQPHEVMGKTPAVLSSGRMPKEFYRQLWATLLREGSWRGEVWNRRKNGDIYPEWLSISTVVDGEGQPTHYVATFSDITQRKSDEERLRYLANYDSLTDLPNRRLLRDRAEQALAQCKRKEEHLGIMFIDVDRFKTINDSLGHEAGDQLLRTLAARLRAVVRESDTVSRIGGDEFVVLVSDCVTPGVLGGLAQRINEAMAEKIVLEGQELVVTSSIGIAVYPEDGIDFVTLSRHADAALYHAKGLGRANFQFFTAEMSRSATERLQLENALHRAIRDQELELHYQPQYRLGEARVTGVEALVRWRRPGYGLVPPDQFIPLAEETGQIVELGQWALFTACHQAAEWNRALGVSLSVAVNLSARQCQESLVERVAQALAQSGLAPQLLVLEVTESALMANPNESARLLHLLRDMGVRIAIDDFGTGYASLSYLKRFPLDKLKIDRSFTDGVPHDSDDVAITSAIIDIARNLKLETVAEGIETPEQQQFMIDNGCFEGQGYLFSRPLPVAELTAFLQRQVL